MSPVNARSRRERNQSQSIQVTRILLTTNHKVIKSLDIPVAAVAGQQIETMGQSGVLVLERAKTSEHELHGALGAVGLPALPR